LSWLIALGVGLASEHWQVPEWMEDVGTWISIAFLTLLGVLNLRAVLPRHQATWWPPSASRPGYCEDCKRPATRWPSPPSAPCSRCPSIP
jgi:hypothetical protein